MFPQENPCPICAKTLDASASWHMPRGETHPMHDKCLTLVLETLEACPICQIPKEEMLLRRFNDSESIMERFSKIDARQQIAYPRTKEAFLKCIETMTKIDYSIKSAQEGLKREKAMKSPSKSKIVELERILKILSDQCNVLIEERNKLLEDLKLYKEIEQSRISETLDSNQSVVGRAGNPFIPIHLDAPGSLTHDLPITSLEVIQPSPAILQTTQPTTGAIPTLLSQPTTSNLNPALSQKTPDKGNEAP